MNGGIINRKRYNYGGFFSLLELNGLSGDDFLVLSGLMDRRLMVRMRMGLPVPGRIVSCMAHFFETDEQNIVRYVTEGVPAVQKG